MNCTAGSYISLDGSSSCLSCESGTYTATDGLSECDTCSAGTYSEFSKGSSRCLDCLAGWYISTNGTSECRQCESGTYTTTEGLSKCDTCSQEPTVSSQKAALCVWIVQQDHTVRQVNSPYVLTVHPGDSQHRTDQHLARHAPSVIRFKFFEPPTSRTSSFKPPSLKENGTFPERAVEKLAQR